MNEAETFACIMTLDGLKRRLWGRLKGGVVTHVTKIRSN